MTRQILERAQTGYHPYGTCRLGKDIKQGVVDLKLQVYGVSSLRIMDASIFPVVPDCKIRKVFTWLLRRGQILSKQGILSCTNGLEMP
jgi:choline dehydrogenase